MTPRVTVAGVRLLDPTVRNITPVEPRNVPFDQHSTYARLFKADPTIWEVTGYTDAAGAKHIRDTAASEEVWVSIRWEHALVVFQCSAAPTIMRAVKPKTSGEATNYVSLVYTWTQDGTQTPGYFYSSYKRQLDTEPSKAYT